MRRTAFLLAIGALLGCSGDASEERFGTSDSWIINGQVDTVHDAVVAVFAQNSGCTATLIHKDGGNAYGLTAAHCFGFGPLQVAVIGDNYNSPDRVLDIFDYQVHPQYNSGDNTYDFAVFTASGADASTPILPALRPEEDTMSVGSQIDHVGYGLLSYPNGQTSVRHHAIGQIDQLAQIQIGYAQPTSGPCSGDSGGPNLFTTPNGERAAGVISYGDQGCENYGVSGRVSAVYNGFVGPYIGNPEPTTTASTSATGSATTVGAGGASSGPTSGAGGSDDWVAGNLADRDIDGNLETGCTQSGHTAPRSGAWLFALALAVLLRRRR